MSLFIKEKYYNFKYYTSEIVILMDLFLLECFFDFVKYEWSRRKEILLQHFQKAQKIKRLSEVSYGTSISK